MYVMAQEKATMEVVVGGGKVDRRPLFVRLLGFHLKKKTSKTYKLDMLLWRTPNNAKEQYFESRDQHPILTESPTISNVTKHS